MMKNEKEDIDVSEHVDENLVSGENDLSEEFKTKAQLYLNQRLKQK